MVSSSKSKNSSDKQARDEGKYDFKNFLDLVFTGYERAKVGLLTTAFHDRILEDTQARLGASHLAALDLSEHVFLYLSSKMKKT